jgi:hypothetical protein
MKATQTSKNVDLFFKIIANISEEEREKNPFKGLFSSFSCRKTI